MTITPDEPSPADTYWLTYQDAADRRVLISGQDKALIMRRGYELTLITGKTLYLWERGQIVWTIRPTRQ